MGIRGGHGQNAAIRQEAKRKRDQDNEWLLAQTNELLAREAERVPAPAHRPDDWTDPTDDQWATDWEDDFERSREEEEEHARRRS